MILENFITEWRSTVPWIPSEQVEQDLIISRALVEIYKVKELREKLAFRGGTALHKIHLSKPYRYSEDLDFIQISQEGIGDTFDKLREVLDPWLGTPKRILKEGLVKLQYRFTSSEGKPLKLKVEINSREHFVSKELITIPFEVNSKWYSGKTEITTIKLEWLLGSKLRALYQRKKSRDAFDLAIAIKEGKVRAVDIVNTFIAHLDNDTQNSPSIKISRAEFEKNLYDKINDKIFNADISLLLGANESFDVKEGLNFILNELISKIPGESWKGNF